MKPKYFNIKELVSKELYDFNPEWKLWLAFDKELLQVIDAVRELIGEPCFINNWSWGGNLHECGLRLNTNNMSQHRFGRAVDLHVSSIELITDQELKRDAYNTVRSKIINEIHKDHPILSLIRGIEDDITWLHIDVRNTDTLRVFSAN